MELVQNYFIPFRSFDLFDIIADGVGCAIGYFISIKRFVKSQKVSTMESYGRID
jgi:VanZ family protein